MDRIFQKDDGPKEEICVHVVSPGNPSHDDSDAEDEDQYNFRFDIVPFRQTFFRYSMYGQSEVVPSSSFVYATHHSSESAWLDVKKLSVALVGCSTIPNLILFSPTVKEVYFMGHITYPSIAFKMLPQLSLLQKVAFNIGFGGHMSDFQDTSEDLLESTPIVQTVTKLEVNINHSLYRTCTEDMKNIFNKVIESALKHSVDSFPNLQSLNVNVPHTQAFLHHVNVLVNSNGILQQDSDIKIITDEGKIQVSPKPSQPPPSLPFDPCALFPTSSQYNQLQRLDKRGFFP